MVRGRRVKQQVDITLNKNSSFLVRLKIFGTMLKMLPLFAPIEHFFEIDWKLNSTPV